MIKRTPNHQIDTKAVRGILTQLDENWLIRNLDERDYGIDLTMERFDGENATGDFFLAQVKGTDSKFAKKVKLSSFPTKTIQYSLLFNVPFFVFYTSNTSKETRFVWLQKYAELVLPRKSPSWEAQEHVTIDFPDENSLSENSEKIIDIIEKDKNKKIGVKFLSIYESIMFHSKNVLTGDFDVGEYCHTACQNLLDLKNFIDYYANFPGGTEINIFDLSDSYREVYEDSKLTSENKEIIEAQIGLLENVKEAFLGHDEIDDFAIEMKAYTPY